MPGAAYRPGYCDWEIAWWLTSWVRLTQPKALQMTYCEICWKLWNDGGRTRLDRRYLATFTMDSVENIEQILSWGYFYENSDGTFSHKVVTRKLQEQETRRANGGKGGRPRNPIVELPEDRTGGGVRPTGSEAGKTSTKTSGFGGGQTIERTIDRSIERTTGCGTFHGVVDNSGQGASGRGGKVKTEAHSASGRAQGKIEDLASEAVRNLIASLRPVTETNRSPSRPWLRKNENDWFEQQTEATKTLFRAEFQKVRGYSLDTGPQAPLDPPPDRVGATPHERAAVPPGARASGGVEAPRGPSA